MWSLDFSKFEEEFKGELKNFQHEDREEIYLIYVMAGSYLCLSIPYAKNRQQVLYVALSNMLIFMLLTVVGFLMTNGSLVSFDYLNLLYTGLNGSLVVIIAVGSEPVWEAIFKITSNERLIELSNSNEPLLKRLILEAPGTYHHSMIVSNLAEKAAMEIKCNYHLARVGSLYHDIGKINRPEYFTENQEGVNIHDELSPDASAKYIIDHVSDGIDLANKYKLPEEIKNIIEQHQGDSVVSYFYNKAVEHSRNYLFSYFENTIKLREVLKLAGIVLLEEGNVLEVNDIDLSPEALEKDTILNLLQ
jgi:putative nucleotidyltransferase with HDIG domain